ncbi:PREDICTED: granulins-like [Priapulus caudatus]|uniref:Granulins-like n=1 Tax=Priapulus caudatus TaxID=37621 RepID=A0ABM1ECG5_PRICU|nr:PREDICTED: granulins-like [Priapulus caudatus]
MHQLMVVLACMCWLLASVATTPLKFQPLDLNVDASAVCGDNKTTCPDMATCCKLSDGEFGCCPFKNAHCCLDGTHCCPENARCDEEKQKCIPTNHLSVFNHLGITKLYHPRRVADVICPGGKEKCPTDMTCCPLGSGIGYGCCPLPKAICCADHTHCCPVGYTCNLPKDTCDKAGSLSIPLLTKQTSVSVDWSNSIDQPHRNNEMNYQLFLGVEDVLCPDRKSKCPAGTTCCMMTTSEWGCCPLPKAVCCKDKLHCCPEGMTCDVAGSRCSSGEHSVPWDDKFIARSDAGENVKHRKKSTAVICPDGKSQCPDQTSCCVMTTGQYGCCPLPKAVCCNDKVHCCPQGTTCDVAQGRCSQKDLSLPWYKKFEASAVNVLPTQEESTSKNGDNTDVKAVICPDGKSQCPDETTCCKMTTGQWGCCPLPNAVCCSDNIHCCPTGTMCDVTHGSCNKVSGDSADSSIPWFMHTPAWERVPTVAVVTPEQRTGLGNLALDNHHSMTLATEMVNKGLSAVICPDGAHQCPDRNTCCKMTTGQYGCCPLLNASCCSDGYHCCPQGYLCDGSMCMNNDSRVTHETNLLEEIFNP